MLGEESIQLKFLAFIQLMKNNFVSVHILFNLNWTTATDFNRLIIIIFEISYDF